MAGASAPWQEYLTRVFPGYLLPSSYQQAIDVATAERFLSRLDPRPELFELLLRSSLIAAHGDGLRDFCALVDELVRVLPSRTHVVSRTWDSGFQGRLNVAATMAQRSAGAPTRFVTRTRRRSFELLENELVRFVAARLLGALKSLRKNKLLPRARATRDSGRGSAIRRRKGDDRISWNLDLPAREVELEHLLHKTVLSEVPAIEVVTPYHEQAAEAAVHECYKEALAWHRRMSDVLDDRDRKRLAEVLAAGALSPLSEDARFEIAVMIRVIEAIEQACEPDGWRFERSIVAAERTSVARFERDDGALIEVFYNQAVLPGETAPLGPRDSGVRHYFANRGRFRPDITILVQRPGQRPRGLVMEVKNSHDPSYVMSGYQEALLYRYEYADQLIQWPKAVVVSAGPIAGALSRRHDVVAVDWERWVPAEIIEAIVPSR